MWYVMSIISVFVDDRDIYVVTRGMATAEIALQLVINSLTLWSRVTGFNPLTAYYIDVHFAPLLIFF